MLTCVYLYFVIGSAGPGSLLGAATLDDDEKVRYAGSFIQFTLHSLGMLSSSFPCI